MTDAARRAREAVLDAARAHASAGRLDAARTACRAVLAADPNCAEAAGLLGDLGAAPAEPPALRGLAALALARGDFAEAAILLRRWLSLRPEDGEARLALVEALMRAGRPAEAEPELAAFVRRYPEDWRSLSNLGVLRKNLGRYAASEAAHRRALVLMPAEPGLLGNTGFALARMPGRETEAERWLRRAAALGGDAPQALVDLARFLAEQGREAEAEALCRTVLARDPEHAQAHLVLAFGRLARGALEAGFRDYEWRRRLPGWAAHRAPEAPDWTGDDPAGRTILIEEEQGLGDAIQFIRYARPLRARGARVIAACGPALQRLFSAMPDLDAVIGLDGPAPPHDAWAPLLSLPHLLGPETGTAPGTLPYLSAEPERAARWRARLAAGAVPGRSFRAGLVWAGSPGHPDDARRSPGLAALADLLDVPGVQTVLLQAGPGRADLGLVPLPPHCLDLGPDLADLADTAAAMAALDLVITCCTAPAHLAGALGCPVWNLVAFAPDWRWGRQGEATSWYPTMRLFRQPRPGAWAPVAAEVRAALAAAALPGAPPVRDLRPDPAGKPPAGREPATDEAERPGTRDAGGRPGHGAPVADQTGRDADAQQTDAQLLARAEAALAADPADAGALSVLGVLQRRAGRHEAAIAFHRRALERAPEQAGIWSNLGNALMDCGRLDEAAAAHEEALRLAPADPTLTFNAAIAFRQSGAFPAALALLERAAALAPATAALIWERALARLQTGDYAGGLRDYEARFGLATYRNRILHGPRWDGGDLAGRTLLITVEQGFGDALLAARYVPLAAERGGRVILECHPELRRVLAGLPVTALVDPGAALPAFDLQISQMSLAGLFGTRAEAVPPPVRLTVPEAAQRKADALLGPADGTLRVGIVWSGRESFGENHLRATRLTPFLRFAEIPGVRLYSLQKGGPAEELDGGLARLVTPLGPHLDDFADTAAVVARLDLVVMTDSAVAHLAGALGRPVWNLVQHVPYWIYGHSGDATPWYPTMRLFRQGRDRAWEPVFARAADALRRLASDRLP
ncbi:tetratricopeptide repeat protein [Methylobacterium sp. ID0610]|uniref:tetratricopeptide repeat protein n=1 Tax=Methylobacterium carpenticola TaxID=3344827 RepID=UPI0036B24039